MNYKIAKRYDYVNKTDGQPNDGNDYLFAETKRKGYKLANGSVKGRALLETCELKLHKIKPMRDRMADIRKERREKGLKQIPVQFTWVHIDDHPEAIRFIQKLNAKRGIES